MFRELAKMEQRPGWRSKTLTTLCKLWAVLSIPAVPVLMVIGYIMIGWIQDRAREQHILPSVTVSMYRAFDLAVLDSPPFEDTVYHIRDSLLEAGEKFSVLPGYDSIAVRPHYNFSSRDGIILCDFFLNCECGTGSGVAKLVVAAIDPDDLNYQIVSVEMVPWSFYLNPWVQFSPQWKGEEESEL